MSAERTYVLFFHVPLAAWCVFNVIVPSHSKVVRGLYAGSLCINMMAIGYVLG